MYQSDLISCKFLLAPSPHLYWLFDSSGGRSHSWPLILLFALHSVPFPSLRSLYGSLLLFKFCSSVLFSTNLPHRPALQLPFLYGP